VCAEIIRLLEDPSLIQSELDRRLAAARTADPARQRQNVLHRDGARTRKSIDRLLTAYQESFCRSMSCGDACRNCSDANRPCRQNCRRFLDQVNAAVYLRLAETLSAFPAKLQSAAGARDILERQRIVRLIVKEILIEDESIFIRHSIPERR
jgi:site-specific DNA recombinase